MIYFSNGKFVCFENEKDCESFLIDGKVLSGKFPKFFEKKYVKDNSYETLVEVSREHFINHFQIWLTEETNRLENMKEKVDKYESN